MQAMSKNILHRRIAACTFAIASALACLLGGALALSCNARADDAPLFIPQWLGAQYTFVDQHQGPVHSPYAGPLSLQARSDTERSHTFGAYFGVALPWHLAFYFDVEMFRGEGVSGATGLGGLTNGDVIRAGVAGLGRGAYVARRYLQWSLPLGGDSEAVERSQDHLPGTQATRRLDVKLGKLAVNDDFDRNRYADGTRTQFMNWDLFNATAWDFAAERLGAAPARLPQHRAHGQLPRRPRAGAGHGPRARRACGRCPRAAQIRLRRQRRTAADRRRRHRPVRPRRLERRPHRILRVHRGGPHRQRRLPALRRALGPQCRPPR